MAHEPWDGSFRDEIQCPHCGAVDYEFADYPRGLNHDGDTVDCTCFECRRVMTVTVSVSYEFATQPAPSALPSGGPAPTDSATREETKP